MSEQRNASFESAWQAFLQQAAMARAYPIPYGLQFSGPTPRNPFLDQLLPTMLFVRLAALLDEALLIILPSDDAPRGQSNSLGGRLRTLRERGILQSHDELAALKDTRNELAHRAASNCDWTQLDRAIEVVHAELRRLSFVGERPKYEAFAERSIVKETNDPAAVCEWEYRFGLRSGGSEVLTVGWTEKLFRS